MEVVLGKFDNRANGTLAVHFTAHTAVYRDVKTGRTLTTAYDGGSKFVRAEAERTGAAPAPVPYVKTDGGRAEVERTFRAEPAGQWDLTRLSECGQDAPPFRVIEPFVRRNDCVCRALTLLTPRSYTQVEQWLCENLPDYNPGSYCTGANIRKFLPVVSIVPAACYRQIRDRSTFEKYAVGRVIPGLRATFTPVAIVSQRVRRFVGEHPRGTFLVSVSAHVFALIDGAVHDTHARAPGQSVMDVWQVKPF